MYMRSINSLHTVHCTRCVSFVSVICVYGVIFISCVAAVLQCSCATGCNFNNVCDTPQSCDRRNMALGKPATITSLFNNTRYNEVSGPACLAVDGNTGIVFRPINQFPDSPNCVHTAENNNPSYWEVDLGRPYDIDIITVIARDYSENQLVNTSIKVDNKTCYIILTDTIFARFINKADIKCQTPQRGQKIQLYKESGLLMFCEVQVWVACGSNTPCAYCGHCKRNTDCDRVSRNCSQGCEPGWTGMECDDACTNGSYGLNCSNTCGNCSEGTTCDTVSGECPSGCKPGYQGSHCNVSCRPGTYGAGCMERCGNCQGNSLCNIYDGRCKTGCAAGYTSPLCKEVCSNGLYGVNCTNKCGNCAEGRTCDFVSGECPNGCSPRYQGILCNEPCRGTYGANCSLTCGRCSGGSDCNIFTGHCETGCDAGYYPPFCDLDCTDGYYGTDCKETCGHCKNNVSCATNTGLCPEGCEGSWQGADCKQASSQSDATDRVSASCAGPVAGAVVGSCAVCTLGFALAILLMRYRHSHGQDKRPSAACFSDHVQTDSEDASRSEPEIPMNNSRVSTNVYYSLTASRDNTVTYTTLDVKRAGDVRSSPYANTS